MRSGGLSRSLTFLSFLLLAGGAVTVYLGEHLLRWGAPPAPPAWAARGLPPGGTWTQRPIGRSVPELISIPRIRVWDKVIPLGLGRNGTAEVPSLSTPFLTSWFDKGPTPGQRGTAIVYGHVDSHAAGPAAFYRIGTLRPGNLIDVTLADQKIAVFRVYSVALYAKTGFPTTVVYRYTRWPSLRLITCGGTFDPRTHHYLGNVVVSAAFVGARA
jgi:hypothetical protein